MYSTQCIRKVDPLGLHYTTLLHTLQVYTDVPMDGTRWEVYVSCPQSGYYADVDFPVGVVSRSTVCMSESHLNVFVVPGLSSVVPETESRGTV